MEYYTVKRLSDSYWSIARYSEESVHLDNMLVSHIEGKWSSNDKGFLRHKNESASKRIRIVKHHVEDGEPIGAYWYEGSQIHVQKA